VDVDNVAASRKVHEYLLSLGHRRIVHFAGPAYSMHGKERIDGVYRAFSESHFVVPENAIVEVGSHLEDGYRVGLEYFGSVDRESRPTAVSCYNDMVAIGLCRALAELGLGVPADVSIVGFDDVSLVEYLPTPLTSVSMPRYEVGKQATELLVRHIESGEILKPRTIRFDAELVVRESTRPLEARPVALGSMARGA
jgi:LacI family transcriptional regulator/LacI family repressor for deo operon, udp, cdd, tsx, nupC, and nupG